MCAFMEQYCGALMGIGRGFLMHCVAIYLNNHHQPFVNNNKVRLYSTIGFASTNEYRQWGK